MAAVHFIVIIMYHIITYVHNGVIRNKTQLITKAFIVWINKKSQQEQFHLHNSIRYNIPEVTYKYHEYREPLIGLDY